MNSANAVTTEDVRNTSNRELQETVLSESPAATPSDPSSAPPLSHVFTYRWRMIVTLIVLLLAWVGAGFSRPYVEMGSITAIVADYCGWLIYFSGLCLRFWATRCIGGRKTQEIVSYGPYSLSRNPLYVGTFLMILSLACFLKSPTFAAATGLVILYYCVAVVPLEERLLRHHFGPEYEIYCAVVPRWLPRIGTIYSYSPHQPMIAHPMREEVRRTMWWLLLPLLAALHPYFRAWPDWPHWLSLP